MTSTCIVCLSQFEVDQAQLNRNVYKVYNNIFETFCEYFNLNNVCQTDPWDFEKEDLPFCNKCKNPVVILCVLKSKRCCIQKQINQVIADITKSIVESTQMLQKRRETATSNCELNSVQSLTNIECSQSICRYRKTILEDYSPAVLLRKPCDEVNTSRSSTAGRLGSQSNFEGSAHCLNQQINEAEENPDHNQDILCQLNSPVKPPNDVVSPQKSVVSSENEGLHSLYTSTVNEETQPLDHKSEPHLDDEMSLNKDDAQVEVIDNLNVQTASLMERIRRDLQDKLIKTNEEFLYYGIWPIIKNSNGYLCRTCGIYLRDERCLFFHAKRLHLDPRKLSCEICKVKIVNQTAFISHLGSQHSDVTLDNKVIGCGHNKYLYHGRWFYEENENGFQCYECGYNFQKRENILLHLHTHKDKSNKDNLGQTSQLKSASCRWCPVDGGHQPSVVCPKFKLKHPIPCDCGKTIVNRYDLNGHRSCDHFKLNVRNATCPVCEKVLTRRRFVRHLETFHPDLNYKSSVLECGDGNVMYEGCWLFVKNQLRDGYQCSYCADTIESREAIPHHIESHPGYICDTCGTLLTSMNALRTHCRRRHEAPKDRTTVGAVGGELFYYDQTHNRFSYRKLPSAEGSNEEVFKCNSCEQLTKSHSEMTSHIRKLHWISNRKWKEKVVRSTVKSFDGSFLYDGKWRYTEENNLFKCSTCSATFKRRDKVTNHIRTVHEKPVRMICDICGKYLFSLQSFQKHMDTHSDVKSFKCTFCDESFTTDARRYVHTRKAHDARTFPCDKCDKVWKTKDKLDKHKKSHSDTKDFKCPDCPKSYKYSHTLVLHRRSVHSKEKPYECSQCQMRFTQIQSVARHIKVVHSEERSREASKGPIKGRKRPNKNTETSDSDVDDVSISEDSDSDVDDVSISEDSDSDVDDVAISENSDSD